METPAPASTGPGGRIRRVAVPLGLAAVCAGLVLGTVAVRDGRAPPTAGDLVRIQEAVEHGCPGAAADLRDRTGFALDGVVVEASAADEEGAVIALLQVQEWFRGPPVDRVEVLVPAVTVRLLDDGSGLRPGARLLVSGDGWGHGGQVLEAAGCGRTRDHDPAVAADWRAALPDPGSASPAGPVARYPAAGFVRGGPTDPPALTGVLLVDRGCLYVDDGLTRWVPVFPDTSTGWVASPPQLTFADRLTDVGHQVRLPGAPASGVVQRQVRPLRAEESVSHRVDEAGVPAACDRVRPRFVVSEPLLALPPDAALLGVGQELEHAARRGAERAGLHPVTVTGETRVDLFGAHQNRLVLRTRAVGDVLVHVETVAVLAWPLAYAPSDARFRWSVDPAHTDALPEPPPGAQLAAVERADGVTQLLLRTGGRVVVSVTADLTGAPSGVDHRSLAEVAAEVALSRGDAGS